MPGESSAAVVWPTIILYPQSSLKKNFRDIRAVHFGSLYLVPMFLGLSYAFLQLYVPAWYQVVFPAVLISTLSPCLSA